jgi:hypothetical protein
MENHGRRETARASRARCTPWAALSFLTALLLPAAPRAGTVEIDCDTTADFCTGDPCVTQDTLAITVPNCTLDFSPAALEIATVVKIPNGGTLSLTAGSITVNAKIDGKHIKAAASDGADVSLTASGNITINHKIDASGRSTPGSITIDAGGDIVLNHQVRARAQGSSPTATGGTIMISADGTVSSAKRGKIVVRGKKKATAGGLASVSGDAESI